MDDDDSVSESESDSASVDDRRGLFGFNGARLPIGERDRDRLRAGDGVRDPYFRYVPGLILRLRFLFLR